MSQEDSQSTQNLFPPQKRLAEIRAQNIITARKNFNDSLILKNNGQNGDEGVHKGILALEDPNPIKALSKLKKDQLLATLGFLFDQNFEQAKKTFSKILVEDLKQRIIEKYDTLQPQNCEECNTVFGKAKNWKSMEA